MPRRDQCVSRGGTHGSRPTTGFLSARTPLRFRRGRCPHRPARLALVGDGVPDVPTARSAAIPSQCGHWRGNPHPPPAGADDSVRPLAHAPLRFRRGRRPRRPPRPQARNLPFPASAGDFCQQRQKSPKTPLETAFQDFLSRVGYDFALTCPTRNRFSGFSGSKDCASTAFRDALSRDAARCRGGCLGALPRGYRQIFYHGRRLCPLRTTSAPCRAGPMCPAGINAYHAAGHMGPALQRVSCPHTPSCDSVGDGVPDVPTARSAVIPSQCGHWRGNPHPPPAGADDSPAPASRSVSWPCPRRNSCCRTPRAPCTHRTGWPRRGCPSSPRWSADPAGRRCRSCRGASR